MIEPTTVRPERVDARGDAGLAARGSGRPARAGVAALFLALLAAPGARSRRPDAMTPFVLRFHLGAGVEAVATADGQAAMLRTSTGSFWHFRSRGERVTIEDSVWVDGWGRLFPTQQIVVDGLAPPGGINVSWVMKRAR